MARRSELASLTGRVEQVCAAAPDDRRLRLAVLEEVRRSVPFDAYAWVVTDPRTWVGGSPMADVPCLPELTTAIDLKYLSTLNRWTTLVGSQAATSSGGVASLVSATGGDLARSLVWRQLQSRYAVTDVASMVFADRFGCWAFLDLWRREPATPFSEPERGALAGISAPVTAALRACQMRTFAPDGRAARQLTGAAVLLLGDDLSVLSQTHATRAVLHSLNPPGDDQPAIPAVAYNVGAQLHAVERGVDDREPSARVHLGDGLWLTLRAARIPLGDQPRQGIAVTIEQTSPADRMDLFSRACGLTPRESELVGLVVGGADTRRASAALLLSKYTVQDHLKAVFAKAGVRSRTALVAQILGQGPT